MATATPAGFTINTEDGNHIFIHLWETRSDKKEKNILFIHHGFGEHAVRYKHVPDFLGEKFHKFYAMDMRGHGRSGGLRGDAPSFDVLVNDLKQAISAMVKREEGSGDKPTFYFLIHSFGGLVGLHYLIKEKKVPFKAAIVSAPLLEVALKIPGYKKFLGENLAKILPTLQLKNEINPSHLSHDPSVIEAYIKDRQVHNKMTPRMYVEMKNAMQWVREQTEPLACPSLFLIPGQDLIVDSNVTLSFYRNLKDRNKELREYPEMFHEILNEVDKKKVFEDILKWLKN